MKKECNVVILATDKKVGTIGLFRDTKNLVHNIRGKDIPRGDAYELYITSDEEIKEGDWVLYNHPITKENLITKIINWNYSKEPSHAVKHIEGYGIKKGYKKIIATTDTSLKVECNRCSRVSKIPYDEIYTLKCTCKLLSQIPRSFIDIFIEQYNEGNVIDKVLVEYIVNTNADILNKNIEIGQNIEIDYKFNVILKINSDNTINISLIEEEKKYSKNDIKELLLELSNDINNQFRHNFDTNKWIEENL